MLQWGEFSNTMQAIEKLKDQSYTAGYHFGDFTPRATSMIAFFYIFVYYYHIKMRKLCMKCLIPSFPLHDVCCIHEVNSVINHEIARDAVKHLTVHKLKEMVFKMIEIYALSSEGFNDYNYEKFLSNIDIKDFNRAIRYHFDPAMTENMNVVPE